MARFGLSASACLLCVVCLLLTSAGESGAPDPPSDQALLQAHNTSAHLLALWRLGQPEAAVRLSSGEAQELLNAARQDADWRVRWLAAEALAQAYPSYHPADVKPGVFYTPPRLGSYSLLWQLKDDCVYVREAAARQLALEPPGALHRLSGELADALGDESETVRSLVTQRLAAELAANPARAEDLLWLYQHARDSKYAAAEDYLRHETQHPEAEAGRQVLGSHNDRLKRQERQLYLIFKQAGAAVMPTLLQLWEVRPALRREIIAAWVSIGAPAAAAGDLLAPLLADPANPLNATALFAVPDIAPRGNVQLADILLPRVFADVQSKAIPDPAVNALKALGPLPEPYLAQEIAQLQAGVDKSQHLLLEALACNGAQSETALSFLKALALDQAADTTSRRAVWRALANLARAGDAGLARWLLEATCDDADGRQQVLGQVLSKVSYSSGNRFYWVPLELLQHPDVVAVLAEELGTVELALRAPELLELPEFHTQALEAALAGSLDPKTAPVRVVVLATLLEKLDAPPGELASTLVAVFSYAGMQDAAYWRLLGRSAPERARDLFRANCDSADPGTRGRAYALLSGLGAEAVPLLDTLAARLVGEPTPGEWRQWLEQPGDDESTAPRPSVKNELELSYRYRLAEGIGGCGPAAAPYAPYLLWALKQAYYARGQATVPVAALDQPQQLEQAVQTATRPIDGLATALTKALAALGPGALATVQGVAAGAYDDDAVPYISSSMYMNPLYDQRLRNAALAVLGGLCAGQEPDAERAKVAGWLARQLGHPPVWGMWAGEGNSALDQQRRLFATEALGKLGLATDEVVAALLKAALDDDASLRQAAVTALRKLAGWEYAAAEVGR